MHTNPSATDDPVRSSAPVHGAVAALRPATLTFAAPAPRIFAHLAGRLFLMLLAFGVAAAALVHETPSTLLQNLSKLFLFDRERNLPTLFNFSLLLSNAGFCALVAVFVWRNPASWRWSWATLAAILFLMSFDKAAQIHERAGFLGRYIVTPTGMFALPWVAVGALAVAAVGLAYLRFVLALPRAIAAMVFLAATLYVGGALGVEMMSAIRLDDAGIQATTTYELLATLEEALEMLGLIVFGYAVLTFLHRSEVRTRYVA